MGEGGEKGGTKAGTLRNVSETLLVNVGDSIAGAVVTRVQRSCIGEIINLFVNVYKCEKQ